MRIVDNQITKGNKNDIYDRSEVYVRDEDPNKLRRDGK